VIIKELENIEKYIKYCSVVLNDIKVMKVREDHINPELMSIAVTTKRKIAQVQQGLVHFEACGFKTLIIKERFERIQKTLTKLDLDISKAVYKKDKSTAGSIWFRIYYEHSPEFLYGSPIEGPVPYPDV